MSEQVEFDPEMNWRVVEPSPARENETSAVIYDAGTNEKMRQITAAQEATAREDKLSAARSVINANAESQRALRDKALAEIDDETGWVPLSQAALTLRKIHEALSKNPPQ